MPVSLCCMETEAAALKISSAAINHTSVQTANRIWPVISPPSAWPLCFLSSRPFVIVACCTTDIDFNHCWVHDSGCWLQCGSIRLSTALSCESHLDSGGWASQPDQQLANAPTDALTCTVCLMQGDAALRENNNLLGLPEAADPPETSFIHLPNS